MDRTVVYRLILLLLVLASGLADVRAQIAPLPEDPDGFIKAFIKLLNDSKREDQVNAAAALQTFYTSGSLDQVMVGDMIEPVNLMLSRRMAQEAYLLPFARTAEALAAYNHGTDRFSRWAAICMELLEGNKSANNKALRTWLEFSEGFYSENALSRSRTRSWIIDPQGYEFRVKDQVVEVFFPLAELSACTTGDTIVLKRARGSYYPADNVWMGTQGQINFERARLPANQVYVDFRAHRIDLSGVDIVVDSAWLTYQPLLDKALAGRFVDKLVVNNSPEKTEYPQFRSHSSEPMSVDLYPNVRYTGSFALKGFRFQGFGQNEQRAILEFFDNNKKIAVRARTAKNFSDDKNRIYSEEAQVSVYLKDDSIFHPNVKLRFDQLTGDLTLSRENKGATSSPFYSSLHKLEINPDQLRWNINDSTMIMGPAMSLGRKEIEFRSTDLFDLELFTNIQGVVSYHPLVIMKRLVDRTKGRREFQSLELAQEFNRSLTTEGAQAIFYQLMLEGFIFYDKPQEKIYILDKTVNYVLSKGKQVDYDALKIKSDATQSGVNSRLNMNGGQMELLGVFEVNLSDSQYVRMFPRGKKLTMFENRDMLFGGTVFGGSADFYGQDFFFSYDSFSVAMSAIDSMVMFVPTGETDRNGRPVTAALNTTISGLSGTLYIDQPDNKSGVEDFSIYPYFSSNQPAKALYDKQSIHAGAYDEERFFFEVDNFDVDSLDNINPSLLGFKGTLKSDGIFPDLKQTLSVMPDRSLGFETQTPANGYALYGEKARYFDQISLSNEGLLGKGRIEYLTAVLESEKFVFFPDSTKGMVESLEISRQDKGVPFPQVSNTGVALNWKPAADSMTLRMRDKPFDFFDNETQLSGQITITPKGLQGSGIMDWSEANATSESFRFGSMSMETDSSEFIIKSAVADRAALRLPNAYAKVDFKERSGVFRSNNEEDFTELPFNRYQTTVNDFAWDMDERRIDFKTSGREYSDFRSQLKKQEGLGFKAQAGSYDMNDHLLKLSGVPYIAVGDAHIIPAEGLVTVEQDAVIRTLKEANIVFDSLYANHTIENATVHIRSRNDFRGQGTYRYVNRLDLEQLIYFDDVRPELLIQTEGKRTDTLYQTIALGSIPDTVAFYLDPKVLYKGPVKLSSASEKIDFNGFAKLNIADTTYRAGWFAMKDEIESDNFVINIDGVLTEKKDTALVGIYRLFGSTEFYPSILAGKRRAKDKEVMRIKGFVSFREEDQSFLFGDQDKAEGFSERGTLMSFNDLNGHIEAEGALNLMTDFGLCKVGAAAVTKKTPQDSVWSFTSVLGIKLLLTPELLTQFGKLFADYNFDAEYLDYYSENTVLRRTLPQLLSAKDEEQIMSGINNMAEFSPGKDYPYDITLTDVVLIWNEDSESWRSQGDTAGIGHIGLESINQECIVAVEFAPRAAGDYFHLYLETEMDDWFYFYYQKNVLKVISSVAEFNEAVTLTDPKKATFRHGNTNEFSVLTVATVSDRNRFLSRMGFFDD